MIGKRALSTVKPRRSMPYLGQVLQGFATFFNGCFGFAKGALNNSFLTGSVHV
jgi:hypothetical protein